MAEQVVVVEQAVDWKGHFPRLPVVLARDYLLDPDYGAKRDLRVINLSRSYRYLSVGYYCSLLAEARRHKVVPTVRTMQDLSSRALYGLATGDLDDLVHRRLGRGRSALQATAYELTIYFGQTEVAEMRDLARQIFEVFRCPVLKAELRLQGTWRLATIKAVPVTSLEPDQEQAFFGAMEQYLSRHWRRPRARQRYRYDLAVLHDPEEALPPSNAGAFKKLIRAGKECGVDVELILPRDFARLAEYDALFIRETTQIDHHTYRFAKKAESEQMVVIDDPDSILKCTNKVYLAELLQANRVKTPTTLILRRETLDEIESRIPYPVVLKIPDGSFSRGVFKAESRAELQRIAKRLFKDSDSILAQEFMYTEFDWRVGVLGRRPLFVCQYYMSGKHWQIVDHSKAGHPRAGGFRTWPVEDAPAEVVVTGLKAANLIGDGLYGVDIKQTDRGIVVIEVNDNPNIDSGVEDVALGHALYLSVMRDFVQRLDRIHQRGVT